MGKVFIIHQINKETIIMSYGIQTFCMHNFGDKHKTKFEHFKEALNAEKELDLYTVLALANEYDVNVMGTRQYCEEME